MPPEIPLRRARPTDSDEDDDNGDQLTASSDSPRDRIKSKSKISSGSNTSVSSADTTPHKRRRISDEKTNDEEEEDDDEEPSSESDGNNVEDEQEEESETDRKVGEEVTNNLIDGEAEESDQEETSVADESGVVGENDDESGEDLEGESEEDEEEQEEEEAEPRVKHEHIQKEIDEDAEADDEPEEDESDEALRSRQSSRRSSTKKSNPKIEPSSKGKQRAVPVMEEDEDEGIVQDEENHENPLDLQQEVIIQTAENYDSDSGSDSGLGDTLDTMSKDIKDIPHQPGAIVRVDLHNFVTYTDVTFLPGPSLNMVIGPNGTGKSTLVCAICLGLGNAPVHLGRAKDIGEFVKNGSDSGTIEIELMKRPQDETNHVVKRLIRRDNSSEYWINGKKASQKAVLKFNKEFNIQIDNLCQFLPQDRVCEFAALTPIDLLRETQRAAAPPVVLEYHEKLKDLQKKYKLASVEYDANKGTLNTLENKQRMDERDVARVREREAIQREIEILESVKPFREFKDARQEWKDAKNNFKAKQIEHARLEEEQAPALESIEAAKKLKHVVNKYVEKKQNDLKVAERRLAQIRENGVQKIKNEETDMTAKIEAHRRSETQRRTKLTNAQAAVTRLEKEVEKEPEQLDVSEFNQKIEEIGRKLRRLRDEGNTNNAKLDPLKTRKQQLESNQARYVRDLKQLDSVEGQRIQQLKKVNSDAFKAYEWLRENTEMFESRVFGPAIIECTIKDSRYIDQVEAFFSRSDKCAFTCTNQQDYEKLAKHIYGDARAGIQGLNVTDVTIKMCSLPLSSRAPACSQDELRSYGLDGFVLDFMDGPPEVLSMLAQEIGGLRHGVALRDLTDEQSRALSDSNISRWVAGRNMTMINRRREYGPSATITRHDQIAPGRDFRIPPVDQVRKNELRRNIAEIDDEIKDILDRVQAHVEENRQSNEEIKRLTQEKEVINGEKLAKQNIIASWNKAKAKLQDARENVIKYEGGGDDYKERLKELEDALIDLTKQRVEAAVKYAKSIQETVKIHDDLVVGELRLLEANSNYDNLKVRSEEIQNLLAEKQAEVDGYKRKADEKKAEGVKLQKACEEILSRASLEEKEALQQLDEKSLDEINHDIQTATNRLELIHEGNPSVIRKYEKRQKEIDALKKTMDQQKAVLDDIQHAVDQIQNVWEPLVDKLMNNISEAFSKSFEFMGCAGQVRVRKEGMEFDKWAVEILVKFRESETMQILTAQRQSGGERAVSTVFYLMALQSLARAPFRVVDEINQGMDPRNERLVHKRMVKIACKEHTSQYFLITPKLLVDLDYHERMKVLCINSGDWVIEDHAVDFKKYFEAGRRLMAAA